MYSKKIRRDTFDKLSYSAWAVSESIRTINDWNGCVDEYTIAEILQVQLDHYIRFGSSDKECHKKYIYAADMIEQLMKLMVKNQLKSMNILLKNINKRVYE